jgi:polyisoprenoid-binding protein YceI
MTHPTLRRLLPTVAMLLALPAFAADTYKIDPVHSLVGFKVKHLGLASVHGRFTKFAGTLVVDPADISKSSVDVTIDTASITTENEMRDNHLRTPDFFDAAKFPAITFKSNSVKQVSPGQLEVTGTFTLKGTAKTVVIPVKDWSTKPGMQPNSMNAGLEATLTIDRNDYKVGISKFDAVVSNNVEISLEVEANRQ